MEEIKQKGFRPPEDWARRGQTVKLVMAALRETTERLTVRDRTLRIMGERGMDRDDDRLVQQVMRRVGSPLRRLRDQGAVRFIELGGQYGAWAIER